MAVRTEQNQGLDQLPGLGRRLLRIGGSAAMVFGLVMVALAAANDYAWPGLAGLCIYIRAFAISLGPCLMC